MDTLTASKEYWKDGLHVIVMGECIEELKKHSASKDNQEARIEAKRALKILHHDKWFHKTLEVTKSNTNYGFADNAIYTAASSLRIQNKVLIITQDKTLATDLRKLNSLDSQRGRYVMVYRLNPNGELEENPGENGTYTPRNYASPKRELSKPHLFHNPFSHHEKTQRPVAEKPVAAPAEVDSPIISADKRLMANLNNPNYPSDKKLADIDTQIATLNSLAKETRDKLSLAYTLDQLLEEKAKLSSSVPAPAKAVTPVAPAPVSDKPVPHPADREKPLPPLEAPLVVSKPEVVSETPKKRLWFEFGSTIQDALTKAGAHSGILFRDRSVPYVPQVHGPYDLTSQDLDELAQKVGVLKPGEKKDLPLGPLTAHIEKTDKDFKATVEITPQIAPQLGQNPAKPAPIEEKKAPLAAQPVAKPVEIKAAVKETPAPVAPAPKTKAPRRRNSVTKAKPIEATGSSSLPVANATVTAPDLNTAVPSGATLVVGIPTNEGKRGFIERKVRREETSALDVAPDPNARQKPSHGKSAKTSKPAGTKTGTKPAVKAPAPKAQGKPAPKASPSKTPAKTVSSAEMEAIVKEDKNLNAKINNPNYPVSNKIADLQQQKGRIKTLKASEQSSLFWNMSKINAKIHELSGKK